LIFFSFPFSLLVFEIFLKGCYDCALGSEVPRLPTFLGHSHFRVSTPEGEDIRNTRVWENGCLAIVKDGIYYALGLAGAGALVWWLAGVWAAAPLWLLALFCLYFFRDPERSIPSGAVAVSPADGKVVAVISESPTLQRISIFLNVFDVHVNRAPIAGTIEKVQYQKGKFHVASREVCSTENEQNVVTVRGEGTSVVFKQIAGLIARRIVFRKKPGDHVTSGERVGLIKFGSRVDVLFGPEWEIVVKPGMRVAGGSSILARRSSAGQPTGQSDGA
jgi:phosphatidylserine decarboxylase